MQPKNNYSSYIFWAVVISYFVSMAFENAILLLWLKPLIVSTLLGYFIFNTRSKGSPLKKWIIGALAFSLVGDTALQYVNHNEGFFPIGLSAFLVAHIFYIICFHTIRTREQISGKWYAGIIVAIYLFLIINLLMPYLGSLKYPAIIYAVVISIMLLLAMHLYDLSDNRTAKYILTGAILFVVSDSAIAINKFYHPFSWAAWAIMITYVLAQWLLAKGVINYILSNKQICKP